MRPSEKFVWGRITQEWEIGAYHIAAYHPVLPSNKGKGVDETQTNYHVWVDGRDTHTSSLTLEGARRAKHDCPRFEFAGRQTVVRVHLGYNRTLRTLCDKPVARRWWIAVSSLRRLLRVDRQNVLREVNCPECLRKLSK